MGGIIRIPRALFKVQAQPIELCATVRYYSAECQIVIELLQRGLPQSKERVLPLLHNPPKACFVALNAAFREIRIGPLNKPKEKLSGSINFPRVFEAYLCRIRRELIRVTRSLAATLEQKDGSGTQMAKG
jgi:hypothetical protein